MSSLMASPGTGWHLMANEMMEASNMPERSNPGLMATASSATAAASGCTRESGGAESWPASRASSPSSLCQGLPSATQGASSHVHSQSHNRRASAAAVLAPAPLTGSRPYPTTPDMPAWPQPQAISSAPSAAETCGRLPRLQSFKAPSWTHLFAPLQPGTFHSPSRLQAPQSSHQTPQPLNGVTASHPPARDLDSSWPEAVSAGEPSLMSQNDSGPSGGPCKHQAWNAASHDDSHAPLLNDCHQLCSGCSALLSIPDAPWSPLSGEPSAARSGARRRASQSFGGPPKLQELAAWFAHQDACLAEMIHKVQREDARRTRTHPAAAAAAAAGTANPVASKVCKGLPAAYGARGSALAHAREQQPEWRWRWLISDLRFMQEVLLARARMCPLPCSLLAGLHSQS